MIYAWLATAALGEPDAPSETEPAPNSTFLPVEDGGSLPLASPVTPEEALYAKVDDEGGRAEGRNRRRRDADYVVWELPSGTVVRYRKVSGRKIIEDHLYDAAGWPTATVRYADNGSPASATVAAVPPIEIPLEGWIEREIPGGKLALPELPDERPGGGARVSVLGGELEIWTDDKDDPFGEAFRNGLVAGCGCSVLDRATTWIDGQPAVRYRLLVPGRWPRDAVDLWAVPRGERLWLMAFRMTSPSDPVTALLPGRVLTALVRLEEAR